MTIEEETYHAPFGLPPSDFESLIRKRFLAHLTCQLIEQGRVRLEGSTDTAVCDSAPGSAGGEDDVANTPDPPVTDIDEVLLLPLRPASSVYSRDVDGTSLCSSEPIHTPASGQISRESLSPALMAFPSPKNSSVVSSDVAPSSAASAGIHNPPSGSATAASEADPSRGLFSLVKKQLRVPSTTRSLPIVVSANSDKTEESNHAPGRPKLYGGAQVTGNPARIPERPVFDLRGAIAALLKEHEQRIQAREMQPPVDQIFGLGRLRRAIRTLDFSPENMIILASDLTTLVPLPTLQDPQERPEMEVGGDVLDTRNFFRERLASTVHRRIARLKLEGEIVKAHEIERWYRDVVDLVGWRDEEETQQWRGWEESGWFF